MIRRRFTRSAFAMWAIGIMAVGVALYGFVLYGLLDGSNSGFVQQKAEMKLSGSWYVWLVIHAMSGSLALLVGWLQFVRKLRTARPIVHRIIGMLYVVAVAIAGLTGLFLAVYASGGLIGKLGFGILSIAWLVTTGTGVFAITSSRQRSAEGHSNVYKSSSSSQPNTGPNGIVHETNSSSQPDTEEHGGMLASDASRPRNAEAHGRWMLRSYALSFAAVTLRIYLPLSMLLFGFEPYEAYYGAIAWLCWVPNLLFAEWLLRRRTAATHTKIQQ